MCAKYIIGNKIDYLLFAQQVDQVYKIIEVLGMPPDHIINKASRSEKFFERSSMGVWTLKRSRDSRKVIHMCVLCTYRKLCYNNFKKVLHLCQASIHLLAYE